MPAKNLQIERELLSPPGDTILETIEHYKISQTELAERLNKKPSKVHDLITGKEPITLNTALQLERVLGIAADFWMNREARYREKLARLEEAEQAEANVDWVRTMPLKELVACGQLKTSKASGEAVDEVLRFFGVASIDAWQNVYQKELEELAEFRKVSNYTTTIASLAAWLRTGELEMRKLSLPEFDKGAFKKVLDGAIKKLIVQHPSDFAQQLKNACQETGVALVYTPCFPKAPVCGATRWMGGRPMIQLTDRYKTNDQFWFTFYHEAGHVLLHGRKEMFIEPEKKSAKLSEKEKEANVFASRHLLPDEALDELASDFTDDDIADLANKYETHPGIVVGRLQYLTSDYTFGNKLKQKINLFQKDIVYKD
jgi:addiction module HigA family antidote